MIETVILYTKYLGIFFVFLFISKYISYRFSIVKIHRALELIAQKHSGTFQKGSLLVPPLVELPPVTGNRSMSLRLFFLYKGRRGNYIEVFSRLPEQMQMTSFRAVMENSNYLDMTLPPSWNWSVEHVSPLAEESFDSLKRIAGKTCERFCPDVVEIRHDGAMVTFRMMRFTERPDEIEEFLLLSKEAHVEAATIESLMEGY